MDGAAPPPSQRGDGIDCSIRCDLPHASEDPTHHALSQFYLSLFFPYLFPLVFLYFVELNTVLKDSKMFMALA